MRIIHRWADLRFTLKCYETDGDNESLVKQISFTGNSGYQNIGFDKSTPTTWELERLAALGRILAELQAGEPSVEGGGG